MKRRLHYRLLSGVLSIFAVSTLLLTSVFLSLSSRTATWYAPKRNIKIAENISLRLVEYVDSLKIPLISTSDFVAFEDDYSSRSYFLRSILVKSKSYKKIYMVDPTGKDIANTNVTGVSGVKTLDSVTSVALSGETSLSGILFDEKDVPYMKLCVPAEKWGEIVGALCAEIDFFPIWQMIENTDIGNTGYAVLFDSRGRFLAHPEKAKIFSQDTLAADYLAYTTELSGEISGNIEENDQYVVTYANINDYQWTVLVFQDRKEVYQFWHYLKHFALAILIVQLLLTAIITYLFTRRVSRPIEKLTDHTRAITAGDMDVVIDIDRGDEIGDLADSFSWMMKTIREKQKILIQREKMASLGEFAASLGHEIQNPISGLLGYAYLLKTEEDATNTIEYANDIEHELKRIQKIVKKLMDLSQKSDFDFKATDLNSIVARSLSTVRHHLKKSGVAEIVEDYSEAECVIYADANLLQQVVLNLLLNASDAIDAEGVITITSKVDSNRVRLSITDNGCGISSENIDNVFEPFFSKKATESGTGLGLYIVKEIVTLHNADISIRSSVGEFTAITIDFPAMENSNE